MEDPIQPGRMYNRAEVRKKLGGSLQGGIVPSRMGRTVLLYSDHSKAGAYGYEDGWSPDDQVYEYTGTGQEGDQDPGGLNGSVLRHRERGYDTLRLFVAYEPPKGAQDFRYVGQFVLDEKYPSITRKGRDKNGVKRDAIVFRLRPVGTVSVDQIDYVKPSIQTTITTWHPGEPIETLGASGTEEAGSRQVAPERNSASAFNRKAVEALVGTRQEAELSLRFEELLTSLGHDVQRFEIRIKGGRSPLRTDLYDATDQVLYEIKASASRDAVRMAIGQLFDYRRHVEVDLKHLAVLLPKDPGKDLHGLIESVGFKLVYEESEGVFAGDVEILYASGRPNAS
ncbi:hypothetical protein L0U85_06105 [Glycomyces sp. L485]|uniref:hypothetical protein n=1 Tax=Glycomyces sp. L485 TaxID=2909235 RepID=UPI001F4BA3EF|nr:hypothetical protein [Glycomyces sp. L485]MCH7230429.1 hypothetical protein [Glycomyces sp. L485]